MIPFQLHRRIPLIRRPFHQRDLALAESRRLKDRLGMIEQERDALIADLAHVKNVAQWSGWCPLCETAATFRAEHPWLRDHLVCQSCPNGSIPRERAIMRTLSRAKPDWRSLRIHESSPVARGASLVLSRDCSNYMPTQFWDNTPLGGIKSGIRCENIEQQTFPDGSFDIVITQDVMEHLFHPERAIQEIYRTLAPGGVYIFTTPIYNVLDATVPFASLEGGRIIHHQPPEFHGNPINDEGSLVTFHYGKDMAALIREWSAFDVDVIEEQDFRMGIVGEFLHVIVCRKPDYQ